MIVPGDKSYACRLVKADLTTSQSCRAAQAPCYTQRSMMG